MSKLTQIDYFMALKYDTIELNKSSFTIQERWSINLERSKLLSSTNYRRSIINYQTKEVVKAILKQIEISNWEFLEPEEINQ